MNLSEVKARFLSFSRRLGKDGLGDDISILLLASGNGRMSCEINGGKESLIMGLAEAMNDEKDVLEIISKAMNSFSLFHSRSGILVEDDEEYKPEGEFDWRKLPTRRVGEEFDYKGKRLRVVMDWIPDLSACDGLCFFSEPEKACRKRDIECTGLCFSGTRTDGNNVYFEEVKEDKK